MHDRVDVHEVLRCDGGTIELEEMEFVTVLLVLEYTESLEQTGEVVFLNEIRDGEAGVLHLLKSVSERHCDNRTVTENLEATVLPGQRPRDAIRSRS